MRNSFITIEIDGIFASTPFIGSSIVANVTIVDSKGVSKFVPKDGVT
jgi:hypothetical protein